MEKEAPVERGPEPCDGLDALVVTRRGIGVRCPYCRGIVMIYDARDEHCCPWCAGTFRVYLILRREGNIREGRK